DYILKNGQADAYFGLSVVLADATGDGLNDLIVGAGYYDNGQNDEGATFIYSYAAAPTPTATPAVTPTPAPVPAVGAAATLGLVLLFGLLLARRRFISL
ncbi:MAG TPA: FG-GAP repeat protein, partial [Promineifilum sp.]|nr:FG-GAP repeat protein [Promineifilum sp.]